MILIKDALSKAGKKLDLQIEGTKILKISPAGTPFAASGLPGCGIEEGCDASFVLVKAHSAAECVAQMPRDRIVFNHGKRL